MGTKGIARQNDHGLEALMRQIPDMVARSTEDGRPIVVTWNVDEHGPMPEHTQRLFATIGCEVRFS